MENTMPNKWVCAFSDYVPKDREEKELLTCNKPYTFGREWVNMEGIGGILRDLKLHGCSPSISIRGKKWRFYINTGTEMYDESENIRSAFRKAFRKWEKAGMPTANERRVSLHVREIRTPEGDPLRQLQWRII